MLLASYRMELSPAGCRPEGKTLHCLARLEQDIGPVIPYLNAVLGGYIFTPEPAVTFKAHGRLITVHRREIEINAVRDPEEAVKILTWLQGEINATWEKRDGIAPSFVASPRPQVFAILTRLPKSNCGRCGQLTCMAFAALVADGGKGGGECPELSAEGRAGLEEYLRPFKFPVR